MDGMEMGGGALTREASERGSVRGCFLLTPLQLLVPPSRL